MPLYKDFHGDPRLSPAAIDEPRRDAHDRRLDAFGVRRVVRYHDHDGHAYGLLEAPDAEAVRAHHAALGVPGGDVHWVDSLA